MSNFGLSTRFSITFCYWDKGNFALTSNQGHFPFVKESAILRGCACYSYPYKMTAQFCSATLFRSGEFPPIHFRPGVAVLETPWHKPIEGEFPAFQFLADLPGLFSVRSLFVSRSSFTLVRCFTVALLKLWNAMLKFYCNPFELKLARQYWQTSLFFHARYRVKKILIHKHTGQCFLSVCKANAKTSVVLSIPLQCQVL